MPRQSPATPTWSSSGSPTTHAGDAEAAYHVAMTRPATPIDVVPLFAGERSALLGLLTGLTTEQWAAPTVCDGWAVRDIAAHLLGDDVGFVSRWRDGVANPSFAAELDISRWDGLIAAIDRQNAEWVRATRRISPPLLVELLRTTGAAFDELAATLDLDEMAGPIGWDGSAPSPVWLHLAREYSERWVHQQHIRDAVRRPGLTGRRWLGPILEVFALAVPPALDEVAGVPGATVRLVVDGEAGGSWSFARGERRWEAGDGQARPPDAEVSMDADTAWRLFTKGITPAEAARTATVRGDATLTSAVLRSVAIMA